MDYPSPAKIGAHIRLIMESDDIIWSCEGPNETQYVQILGFCLTSSWLITFRLYHYNLPPGENFSYDDHPHYFSILVEDWKFKDGMGAKKKIVLSVKAEPGKDYYDLLKELFEETLLDAFKPASLEERTASFSQAFLEKVNRS